MTAKMLNKQSYTVPCASRFRDEIMELAKKKHCNVADLARSVALVVPRTDIDAYKDPGEPPRDDRETVVLKSGRSMGKPWRRKPRLQVRMAPGYEIETIRKALALALAIDHGNMNVGVESEYALTEAELARNAQHALLRDTKEEMERLRNVVQALHFDPIEGGVHSRAQALYILGFPPGTNPDIGSVRLRFRKLATVYHPDGKDGCHQRMSQLNAAMELLRRSGH